MSMLNYAMCTLKEIDHIEGYARGFLWAGKKLKIKEMFGQMGE
jgi:hypothetical protein